MKIRTGFVSNSSSSSFTLAYKPPSCHSDVPLEKYMKSLVIEAPSTALKKMFGSIIISMIKGICSNAKEVTAEEWLENCRRWFPEDKEYFESIEQAKEHDWDYINQVAELFEKGFKIYEGAFSNCATGAEGFLCEESLNFETPHLVMMHEGGL